MIFKKHKLFEKSYKKLNHKLQNKVDETLLFFSSNPFANKLRNHELKWDYRIIFREMPENKYEIIELIKIWKHSQLYD